MRATLPLMLGVSLALHGLIAGGVALSFYHGSPLTSVKSLDDTSTLTLIPPALPPVRPSSVTTGAKSAPLHLVAMSRPAALPPISAPRSSAIAPLFADKGLPVLPKTEQVPEANPNAHLPLVAPEAVLSPMPPPHLDGTKGVVFILDISGSMYEGYAGSTRLAYARQALSRRVRALPDGTPFAIVLYAQRACPSGPLVAANDATREAAERFLMRDVDCGGGTNLPAGLVAARVLRTGALVLATDGDLNISIPNLMLATREILGGEGVGPSIEVIGIGPRPGTTADQLLQDLADQEGGSYGAEPTLNETASLAPPNAAR